MIGTISLLVVLSIVNLDLTEAGTQNLAQRLGAIDQTDFAVHPNPRFRRATDDSVDFPKEQTPQAENAQPTVPTVANVGEANKNGTQPDLEDRFGLLGTLAHGVISGLANQGYQQNYGPGFGGGYPGYGGYNQYPGYGMLNLNSVLSIKVWLKPSLKIIITFFCRWKYLHDHCSYK